MIRKFFPLGITIFCFIFFPTLFPKLKIQYIAPLLTLTALTAPLSKVYRYALLGGAILDLVNSSYAFGFFTLSSLFATWVIHSQRHNFFADKLWGLTLYTALFSLSKTIFEIVLLAAFSTLPPFTWKGILSECIIMSIVDGLYSLVIFTAPFYFGKQYFKWKSQA